VDQADASHPLFAGTVALGLTSAAAAAAPAAAQRSYGRHRAAERLRGHRLL